MWSFSLKYFPHYKKIQDLLRNKEMISRTNKGLWERHLLTSAERRDMCKWISISNKIATFSDNEVTFPLFRSPFVGRVAHWEFIHRNKQITKLIVEGNTSQQLAATASRTLILLFYHISLTINNVFRLARRQIRKKNL